MPNANRSHVLLNRPWRSLAAFRRGARGNGLFDAADAGIADLAAWAARHLVGLAVVALIVVFYRHTNFDNQTTVGFTFLLAVLCASTVWGLSVAIVMSIAAAVVYDYYFLPPVGFFNISDYRDWIALCSFLVTASIGAYLSAWARREATMADERRHETEQLYSFSQLLLAAEDPKRVLEAIPRYVVESFGTGPVALSLADRRDVYSYGLDASPPKGDASFAEHGTPEVEVNQGPHVVPLRVGAQILGNLRISGSVPSPAALDALGALTVVGVERARAIERTTEMEAARKTERLKEVFLDALAHDFKTPLTSIKGSATALLSELDFGREERKELLTLIDEECDRINQLIVSASEMAKLDAGQIKLDMAPHAVGELVSASLADCRNVLRERRVDVDVEDENCVVLVDLSLAKKVLVHLIDNANLYSSSGEPIKVRVERNNGRVLFSVTDRGPGIEDADLGHVFEKFYRGAGQRDRVNGTGMGLAIAAAIVRAHGGNIEATSERGKGSVFSFYLPIAKKTPQEQVPAVVSRPQNEGGAGS